MTNHNVDTCKKKKEHTIVATTEAAQPSQKNTKNIIRCMSHLWFEWTKNGRLSKFC
jgi:hypothetical protein